ncbi:hypothetical protein Dda_2211 [Drechslerella dactyloides]|uniref:Glucosamine 6-phosphate N-acetyltransferase n=1 Tax=Drechslerella dactyloides TaxID=74499 RepID=A0AAD6J397_DREDA|nr:hypothetical protein Dda_2211 [Drechslerella dactyloides]
MPFSDSTTPFIHPIRFTDPAFSDAMSMRIEVFVNEQGVPLENEQDELDKEAIHWVVYASIPRISPPSSSSQNTNRNAIDGTTSESELSQNRTPVGTIRLIPPHASKKPYVLLGRLAVLKPFRTLGLGKLLVQEALRYAETEGTAGRFDSPGEGIKWDGKCYIHAQTQMQGWWAKNGFYIDDVDEWDEEGIPHIGMWRDIVLERRRGSIMI